MEYAAFKTEENSSARDFMRSVKAEVMAILVLYFNPASDMDCDDVRCVRSNLSAVTRIKDLLLESDAEV